MSNITKIVILTALFTPASAFAVCTPQDFECKQLEALQKSGIKPIEHIEAPATITPSRKKESTFEIKPFEIPPATKPKPKETTDSEAQKEDTTAKQPATKLFVPPVNIYTQNANTQNQEQEEFKFQPPKSPLMPTPLNATKQPQGIQYQ